MNSTNAAHLAAQIKPVTVDLEALAARPGRYMGEEYINSFLWMRDHFEKTRPHWTAEELDAETTRQTDAACYVKGAPKPTRSC
ncbi:hypothetical protein SEA_EDEN_45 [Microbacterium phage Eden]|uniref:Uncharacterized protein n=1 Tax=Microbacterium phage Eden TaxID=2250289 RepID=A0A345KWD8_9CAUD|nr:hypothetical protein HOT71_gp45 [Microbacterium phage Eden]AXH47340.1 hypothetical protein SEA_EDEN_45 [Microbacterium phage Eden]